MPITERELRAHYGAARAVLAYRRAAGLCNLTAYLFEDSGGRRFSVVGRDYAEAQRNAIAALRTQPRCCPRYAGLCWSLPGVYVHAMLEVK
jgi:hypothetical protein